MTIIVTIDPTYEMSSIILRIANAGLEVSTAMPMLNIITVSATMAEFTELGIIPGIIAIENDSEVRITHDDIHFGPSVIRPASSYASENDLDAGFTKATLN